jgi:hypothetical protein
MDIFSTDKKDSVFVDIAKRNQTYLTSTCEIVNSRGQFRFNIPYDLFGSVELHVYKIKSDGTIIRDSRSGRSHPEEINVFYSLTEYLTAIK